MRDRGRAESAAIAPLGPASPPPAYSLQWPSKAAPSVRLCAPSRIFLPCPTFTASAAGGVECAGLGCRAVQGCEGWSASALVPPDAVGRLSQAAASQKGAGGRCHQG